MRRTAGTLSKREGFPLKSWPQAARDARLSGATASVLSALVLALRGKVERGSAAGPNNGPSQWIWGREAAYEQRATLRHTLTGFTIHHLMSTFWAIFYEKFFGGAARSKSVARHLAEGAITAGLACFVDYRLTPRRFRPGFEKQLRSRSLAAVYAAFAIGLVLPDLVTRTRSTGRVRASVARWPAGFAGRIRSGSSPMPHAASRLRRTA